MSEFSANENGNFYEVDIIVLHLEKKGHPLFCSHVAILGSHLFEEFFWRPISKQLKEKSLLVAL